MRLIVAEDSVLLREGLIRLLAELGHEVVDAVGDADALVISVAKLNPDAVVTDVRMPPTHTDDGLRAAGRIRAEHGDIGVLVLSQWVEVAAARDLLRRNTARGGVAYLLKDRVQDIATVQTALDVIAAGGTMIDPEVIAQLAVGRPTLKQLTARESDVLALVAQGRSNAAIAAQLFITPGAVEKHIASIFMKLDLANSPDDHRRVLAVLKYLGG